VAVICICEKMQVGKVFSMMVLIGMALLRTYELSRKRNAFNIISFLGILILMSLQKENLKISLWYL